MSLKFKVEPSDHAPNHKLVVEFKGHDIATSFLNDQVVEELKEALRELDLLDGEPSPILDLNLRGA